MELSKMNLDKQDRTQSFYSIKKAKNEKYWLNKHLLTPTNTMIRTFILNYDTYQTKTLEAQPLNEQEVRDRQLLDDISKHINDYILEYKFDDTDLFTLKDSYIKSYNEFKITKTEIKKQVHQHHHRKVFKSIIQILYYRTLSITAYLEEAYELAFQLNSFANQIYGKVTYIDTDLKSLISEYQTANYQFAGSKGGQKKAENFKRSWELALEYYNKFFNEKDENGKFKVSASKAADKIITYYDSKHQSLGYEVSTLARKINEYRKKSN